MFPKWLKNILKGTKDTINEGGVINDNDRKADKSSSK